MPGITARPINQADPGFGATLDDVDIENLSDADFTDIWRALYQYNVVHIKSKPDVSPKAQAELTRRFDPAAKSYGHGKTLDAKRSILHPDLKTVPHQPEVQVIGHGLFSEYEGLKDIKLKHPHHKTFHKSVITEQDDHDFTRFYRWHIDAALFGEFNPPLVTSLLAVQLAERREQTLRYDDGSDETLEVPLGTTAFVSGYKMFDLLSPEQKEFALSSKVEYAAHPYIWISSAKSRSDGLGMVSEGSEVADSSLPLVSGNDIQILPMCWVNPLTGKVALQIHPSVVRKIHLKDGIVIEDLAKVREIVHGMQRPGISPQHVYAHDWKEGDLVLFNNHGVLHSVVGAFADDEVRLFRQCNLAASRKPFGPGDEIRDLPVAVAAAA